MGSISISTNTNGIDWNSLLDAVMRQESQPMAQLQTARRTLQLQSSTYSTLATKLSTLQTAVDDLSTLDAFGDKTASNTDTDALTVTTSTSTTSGTYDIVVNELARAQVTASNSAHADKDATVVASGGTLTIGGVAVNITGDVTLEGLAAAVNATDGIGVVATIVQSGTSSYQLVLTGTETGATHAFTITNALTGGAAPVAFIDTDADGISGDSSADNAVQATSASITVNNITAVSDTNAFEDAIPGASLTVAKKDAAKTVTVVVSQDLSTTKTKIESLVTAYNDFVSFTNDQVLGARTNAAGSIGRDGLLRTLKNALTSALLDDYSGSGSSYARLAEIGIGFKRDGTLEFDSSAFDDATASGSAQVEKLFAGNDDTTTGAFDTIGTLLDAYTESGGLLPETKDRVDDQTQSMADRIDAMQLRLDIRRAALQREYLAADNAMTQLRTQSGSLSSLGGQYRLF